MLRALSIVSRIVRRDEGQDLIEYALLATLIAVAMIAVVTQLGHTINSVFWQPLAQNF
jgi:Flp pilus assembly pilin Flp